MKEMMKEFLEGLPKPGEPAWYFTFDEKTGVPMCMLSTLRGCVTEHHLLDGQSLVKISKYYLRNDDHSVLFTVPKIWKTREEALLDIGGHVLGRLTEIAERPTTNSDPNSAA